MFWQMVRGALVRERGRFMLIALTVALGVSLATAMLNVMFDVGDKVNQELKAFGANITVSPRTSAVLKDIYGEQAASSHREYLREDELGNIKTIFWTNNIVAFAPSLSTAITAANGENITAVGTWFAKDMLLPTGENYTTGIKELKSWWHIDGAWPNDNAAEAIIGTKLAAKLNLNIGDTLNCVGKNGEAKAFRITGVVTGGGAEEEEVMIPLAFAQDMANLQGKVEEIEVSAITTPENELARKAAADPKALSQAEYDIWYCTAYVGSIAYQIEEVLQNATARPVRQIAESEGKILDKTQLLMMLITVLSLLSSALGVSNLVSALVMERSKEFGLLKALGATNIMVILSVLAEIFIVGIVGGIVGYFIGLLFAQFIGVSVFGSPMAINIAVVPIVIVLMSLVMLLGSVPAVRALLALHPAEVLHGR